MEMLGERRQGALLVPLLDRVDEPHVLVQDPEQVTWIAPRPHLHQADETAELVE